MLFKCFVEGQSSEFVFYPNWIVEVASDSLLLELNVFGLEKLWPQTLSWALLMELVFFTPFPIN